MIICGIDFETTGLDPAKDEAVEVGLVLYDWKSKKPLKLASYLVVPSIPMGDEAKKITGLKESDFKFAVSKEKLTTKLNWFLENCDFVMAHNAKFDKPFAEKIVGLQMSTWLCTRVDIEYDEVMHKAKNLVTLAATHGFLNPFPHRALFDVLTMLKIASNYDIGAIIERSKVPVVKVISRAPYDRKDEVKNAGFHWDAQKKIWFTEVKECDIAKAKWDFPFYIAEEVARG